MREKLIFDLSREGRKGYSLSGNDTPELPLESILPATFLRKAPAEVQLNICCS
jgi:glycine dehydrogenase subunit 2